MIRLTASSVYLLLATASAGAAQSAVSVPATVQHELRSTINGTDYRLFVALPEGYTSADTVTYPVLYLLDGNDAFPLAVGAYRYLRLVDEVPDLIIVGIGYPVRFYRETLVPRWRDYSPSPDTHADSIYKPAVTGFLPAGQQVTLRAGGGKAFLDVLQSEIIPLVDRTYRTQADRGLWGHSLAGVFAAYALFNTRGVFSRFGLHSPATWWNSGEIYQLEAAYASKATQLEARVFISVGGDEGAVMVAGADSVRRVLAKRAYRGMVLHGLTLEQETHMSSVPAALSKAMRSLYADKIKK